MLSIFTKLATRNTVKMITNSDNKENKNKDSDTTEPESSKQQLSYKRDSENISNSNNNSSNNISTKQEDSSAKRVKNEENKSTIDTKSTKDAQQAAFDLNKSRIMQSHLTLLTPEEYAANLKSSRKPNKPPKVQSYDSSTLKSDMTDENKVDILLKMGDLVHELGLKKLKSTSDVLAQSPTPAQTVATPPPKPPRSLPTTAPTTPSTSITQAIKTENKAVSAKYLENIQSPVRPQVTTPVVTSTPPPKPAPKPTLAPITLPLPRTRSSLEVMPYSDSNIRTSLVNNSLSQKNNAYFTTLREVSIYTPTTPLSYPTLH